MNKTKNSLSSIDALGADIASKVLDIINPEPYTIHYARRLPNTEAGYLHIGQCFSVIKTVLTLEHEERISKLNELYETVRTPTTGDLDDIDAEDQEEMSVCDIEYMRNEVATYIGIDPKQFIENECK